VLALAESNHNFYASVGVHPDYEDIDEPTLDELVRLANHPKVIAIGETGLDYFRLTGDLEWQRKRFRTHIRAAITCGKPLIIHTRNAADDTLCIMREENAQKVGGVMHCFTENLEVALQAIELGFYISFSGIVTFKNALTIKEVAKQIPLNRMLVETDSPYLAPMPYRGKTNQPSYVKYVAEEIARLRGITFEEVANLTTENFFRLFTHAAANK
jgi:TatD DNase family protein